MNLTKNQKQVWEKKGLIIKPQEGISWMSHYAGPSFAELVNGDILRIYVSGRDSGNISRIGIVDVDAKDMRTIINISPEPIFNTGELGCFDERGVSYPWIVDSGGQRYLYYVGWVKGGICGFQNFVGLAISKDGGNSYQRVSKAPIIGRTNSEPVGSGSVAVRKEGDLWRLWYTSFEKWQEVNGKKEPFYHIKYAESSNGIQWDRQGQVAIDFKDSQEHVICKPMIVKDDSLYRMYYSYRSLGHTYRIGYATSLDGISWERLDGDLGMDVSKEGWDSEMIEYSYIFDYKDERYMIYNGNQYGKTGLGLARLVS